MSRDGMVEPTAAGASPPATNPRASTVNIAVDTFTTSIVRDWLDRTEAQRSRLFAPIPTKPSGSRAIADIDRRSKSP
jgi:hypothetical protein